MKSLLSLALLVGAAFTACTFATSTTTTTPNNDPTSYEIPNHNISNDTLSSSTTYSSPFYTTPPGCDCNTSANDDDVQCHQFDCLCSCDLTAGVCDMNCCCDQECSSDEVSSFSSCLDSSEGMSSPLVKMCVERPPSLEGVNLQYPFRLSDSPEDKLHGLMCVEKDNSAVKGNYFIDQGYPSASQVFEKGSKQVGFHSYFSREETTSKAKTSAAYQLGDGIVAYHQDDNTTLTNAFGGYLVFPTSDSSGNCIELNTVSFGKSETNTCTKHTSNLASDCEGQFSTARYISNVVIEKTKGSTNSLESIRIAKFTNSSGSVLLTDDLEEMQLHQTTTTWDESTQTCTNALKKMKYNIQYNHTSIIDISVELETIDIVENSETSSQQLQQMFAANFMPDEVEERSHEQNNLITRTKSGNPGYIIGSPTLGAISPNSTTNNSTASSYVVAQRAGFTIMDTGLIGQCDTSSPTGSTVGFAKNMIVGCTQDMTRQELKDFCTFSVTNEQEQHPMLASHQVGTDNFVYPKWLETNQDLLGIFGNADPMDRRQWIKIESPLDDNPSANFTIKSRSFVEAESRCIGMPSRLQCEILWTYVGNVDKPQAKILSARKSFEDGPTLQHTLPANEKQPFSFTTTVSWTFLEPRYETVKSPPPTLLFSVPHDVFYPFQMNSGVSVVTRSLVWTSLVAVCTTVLLW